MAGKWYISSFPVETFSAAISRLYLNGRYFRQEKLMRHSFICSCFMRCETKVCVKLYPFSKKYWFNLFKKIDCTPTFIVKNTILSSLLFSEISEHIGRASVIFRKRNFPRQIYRINRGCNHTLCTFPYSTPLATHLNIHPWKANVVCSSRKTALISKWIDGERHYVYSV